MGKELTLIRKPMITEKGTRLQETLNQYTFEVDPAANKIEIKAAVEARFSVSVTNVRTSKIPGKLKRLGRFSGRRPDRKKAIVTLVEGSTIDFLEASG